TRRPSSSLPRPESEEDDSTVVKPARTHVPRRQTELRTPRVALRCRPPSTLQGTQLAVWWEPSLCPKAGDVDEAELVLARVGLGEQVPLSTTRAADLPRGGAELRRRLTARRAAKGACRSSASSAADRDGSQRLS